MNTRSLFFIFLVVVLMCGSASADFILSDGDTSEPYNSGYIRITGGDYTWQQVVDYVNSTKGFETTNSSYFYEYSPKEYFLRVRLQVDSGASIDINSTDIITLRTGYLHSGGSYTLGGSGSWFSDGVTYQTWSEIDGLNVTGSRRFIFGANSHFNNCVFDGATSIYLGEKSTINSDNSIMEHCEITNHTSGLLYHGDNITMDYVNVHAPIFTAGSSGIKSHSSVETDCTNVTISNCKIWNIGDVASRDSTGTYGIQTEGMYNTVSNCSVDGIRYVAFNLKGNWSTFEDLEARNATHNIVEAMASNSIYRNITIGNSVAGSTDSALFTALEDNEGVGNVTFENIVIDDTFRGSGGAIKLVTDGDFAIEDYTYKNITSGYGHLYLSGIKDVKFINVTMDFGGSAFFQLEDAPSNSSEKSRDVVFVDCSLTNGSSRSYLGHSYNVSFANSLYDGFNTFTDANYTELYPLNVKVLNTTGYPVQNANLTLSVTTFGLDGLGNYFVNTSTDENGYPVSPIYVPDYLRDSSTGYTYYNLNTVSAEKDGESATSAAFNPDETWYSIDSSSPNGTLITLTLDVTGLANDTYTIETQAEKFPVSTFIISSFVAVVAGFFGLRFGNQRRKR